MSGLLRIVVGKLFRLKDYLGLCIESLFEFVCERVIGCIGVLRL